MASVFTGLGYGLGGMVASTMLISRWFSANMATAAGIAAVGSGRCGYGAAFVSCSDN